MKPCALCRKPILPLTPTVEIVGGFFDPDDPDFFVMDDGVLAVSHAHRDCLREKLVVA